ncbi:hypothetical protein QA802_13060 [Streptomyces sp. B21-105]|uniref:hypothetical protein n=1 Tax=Streptomyces sp. B21-105 TaxID=3039417 RepID=UPI002FEF7EDB
MPAFSHLTCTRMQPRLPCGLRAQVQQRQPGCWEVSALWAVGWLVSDAAWAGLAMVHSPNVKARPMKPRNSQPVIKTPPTSLKNQGPNRDGFADADVGVVQSRHGSRTRDEDLRRHLDLEVQDRHIAQAGGVRLQEGIGESPLQRIPERLQARLPCRWSVLGRCEDEV